MSKEIINPNNVHKPRGYSHAIKVDKTVYVAGQVAIDPEGAIVGKGDWAVQAEQIYENMKRVLEAAGATMRDVVGLTYYVTDIDKFFKETRDARRKYFGDYFPTSTSVEISRLAQPEFLMEVNAIAVMD
jgi:reactive intermediate/imine deaminase